MHAVRRDRREEGRTRGKSKCKGEGVKQRRPVLARDEANRPLQEECGRGSPDFVRVECEVELSFGKAVSSHPFLRQGKPHSMKSKTALRGVNLAGPFE